MGGGEAAGGGGVASLGNGGSVSQESRVLSRLPNNRDHVGGELFEGFLFHHKLLEVVGVGRSRTLPKTEGREGGRNSARVPVRTDRFHLCLPAGAV